MSSYSITGGSNFEVMRKKGNDHLLEKLLIVVQILLFSTIGNVYLSSIMQNMSMQENTRDHDASDRLKGWHISSDQSQSKGRKN